MPEKADEKKIEYNRRRIDRTTVLWTGSLLCDDRVIDCVIENVSASGAMVRVEDPFVYESSIILRNARLGDLSGEVAWRKENEVGIRFSDEPETVARIIGEALP